jgi:CheY-like chemotaxis protein
VTRTPADASILVVDDNPNNLGVLFDLLSEHGFEVLVANDGKCAGAGRYAHPDLISDILLPGVAASLSVRAEGPRGDSRYPGHLHVSPFGDR